jgi:hypothetical protein
MKLNLNNLMDRAVESIAMEDHYSTYLDICKLWNYKARCGREDFDRIELKARASMTEYLKKWPDASHPLVCVKIDENTYYLAQKQGEIVRIGIITKDQYKYLIENTGDPNVGSNKSSN